MSLYAIKEYRNEVEKIIHYGGTKKETAIRNAFYVLLNKYATFKNFCFSWWSAMPANPWNAYTIRPFTLPKRKLMYIDYIGAEK